MPDSVRLFLQHPNGHQATLPCIHLVQQHPSGHAVYVPCTHGFKQQHPEGDTVRNPFTGEPVRDLKGNIVRTPCIHLVTVHPQGDRVTVPCTHIVPQHPEGHPGPTIPCAHPMEIRRAEYGGLILFYTNDAAIQNGVMDAVDRLNTFGVSLISPRPLHIFHRQPIGSGGGDDPFWSHYNPILHSIQIINTGQPVHEKIETLRHEIGHALVGNQITNHYAGGSHLLTSAADSYALAMSEGWAHFVALALTYDASEGAGISYKGLNWENPSLPPNGKVEYCVGCCLWDLFDTVKNKTVSTRFGQIIVQERDELASIAFSEFFRVYSPTLQTIQFGPWIRSIWDFLARVKANNADNPTLVGLIDEITLKNVGQRPNDA